MARHCAHYRVALIVALLTFLAPLTTSAATNPNATQATPAAACSTTPAGLLLVAPGFTNGQPDAGLNVIEPGTGKILRKIAMPAVQFGLPETLPNHALVETLDGQIYIVDAMAGTAIKIESPGGPTDNLSLSSYRFNDSAGTRWALLGDSSLSDALLVNLQTGNTIDLKALLTGKSTSPIIASAAVASDDEHVLIWDGTRLFLAVTSDPTGSLRPLGGTDSYGGSFSPDGKEVVYTDPQPAATPGSGATSRTINLVVERADGSTRKIVGTSPYSIRARWIDQSHLGVDQIVDAGGGKISRFSVLNLDTSASVTILPYAVTTGGLVAARDGRWLLHQHQDGDSQLYEWIDLENGTLKPLPALTNLFPFANHGARWTVFSVASTTQGSEGQPYVGFDIETGQTMTDLTQESGKLYSPLTRVSPDGRFAALEVFQGSETQLWLLDNLRGTSRQVSTANVSSVAFSPDNCWLAISSLSGTGNARKASLVLEPLNGGRQVELGQGLEPIWLSGS